MKAYDPETLAYLARRGTSVVRILFQVWARSRSTGAIEGLGVWHGDHDLEVTIRGESRSYLRIAASIAMDEIATQAGTDVFYTELRLSPIDEAVAFMMTGYDLRNAPVEIHRALFWPETGALVAEPERLFKGWIDRAPQPVPEVGAEMDLTLVLASANLALGRTLALKKSDPALSAARSGDRFRRYTDVGSVIVPWGEKRVGTNQSPAPAAPRDFSSLGPQPLGSSDR